MTQPALTPTPLDADRFVEIIELVRRRTDDQAAAQALDADPVAGPTWRRLQDAMQSLVTQMDKRMRPYRPDDYRRHAFGRPLMTQKTYVRAFHPEHAGLLTPELAVALGELSRVARMEPAALAAARLTPAELSEHVREGLADEAHIEVLYPLAHVVSDAVLRHPGDKVKPGEGGLPLAVVFRALRDMDLLQDRLTVGRKMGPVARANIGHRTMARMATELAGPRFMDIHDLPAAYQTCYDEHWHTNPRTLTATGAFVEQLRDWTGRSGKPELLVVLAASSDGRNRAVSGRSDRTPEPVYDKMIYDNALAVLCDVVQNKRFNNDRAYAMMKTNGAHQLVAIMMHGRVNLGIRTLACEQAIRHPGVDPFWVYSFLKANVHFPDDVPHGYWADFVKETKTRLNAVRVHGDKKQISMFETRLKRFSKAFLEDVLAPYADAAKEIMRAEGQAESPRYRQGSYAHRQLETARQFVRAHEFVRDPELLDLVLETEREPDDIVSLLTYCVEAGIPITQSLMVNVLQHESREVRETAIGLVPKVNEEEVIKAAAELRLRIQADFDAVRDKVLTEVIPEFEDITGILRKRSANHHYFEAADDIPLDELVALFQRCYEQNPTTIPEQFYEASTLRRFRLREEARQQGEARTDSPAWREPRSVMQADLFGDAALAGQSTTVDQKAETPAPRLARR